MTMIQAIPGINWATDVLLGNRPFPYMQEARKKSNSGEGFKEVFDAEVERLRNEDRARNEAHATGVISMASTTIEHKGFHDTRSYQRLGQ